MTEDTRHQHTAHHERFRIDLAHRRQLIVECWTRLRRVNWSSVEADLLRSWIHGLGNSCTTYGMPALGEYARELEHRLRQLTLEVPRSKETEARVALCLERLTEQIERVLAMDPAEMSSATNSDSTWPLVYVADDDANDLALVTSCLRACGYRVKAFVDPAAMVSELALDAPVALITDLGFPAGRWQGVEAVAAMRAAGGCAIPVVFLSARADVDARVRAHRAGATAFLTKPVELNELLATLRLACVQSASAPLRVLVIADDELDASAHAEVLVAAGMTATVLTQPLLALQTMPRLRPEVLLLDLRMAECSGPELVRVLSEVPEYATLPMVCLSADAGQVPVSWGSDLGIHRVLGRPAKAGELVQALRQSVLERERWIARLGRVMHLETTRGACAREKFLFRLDTAIAAASARGPSTALVYLTLDQLAEVHASLGFDAVMEIESSMEKSVSLLIGDEDCWTVLGTSVIAVLLAPRSRDGKREFLAALAQEIASSGFWYEGTPVQCTTSAIVLPLSPGSGRVNEILAKVELAGREARSSGGSKYTLIEQAGTQLQPLPGELAAASADSKLPVDRLALHLQPIVNERRVEQHVFDVLVRFRDRGGRLLPASAFLPRLDAIGLAQEVDRWVMATAVEYLTTVLQRGKNIELAVRLSAMSLQDPALLDHVGTLVSTISKESGNRLVLQIEEAWLAMNEAAGIEVAVALRELGCGVMLWNFGGTEHPRNAAWASWVDYAKLSPRRLSDINGDAEERSAVERMIREAQVRGARVIACQVEDEETMATLCRWGVRLFQGKLVRM